MQCFSSDGDEKWMRKRNVVYSSYIHVFTLSRLTSILNNWYAGAWLRMDCCVVQKKYICLITVNGCGRYVSEGRYRGYHKRAYYHNNYQRCGMHRDWSYVRRSVGGWPAMQCRVGMDNRPNMMGIRLRCSSRRRHNIALRCISWENNFYFRARFRSSTLQLPPSLILSRGRSRIEELNSQRSW